MNRIVQVLMYRDGMNQIEATKYFNLVREMVQDAIDVGDADQVEDILRDELGLEMDYIYDIL